VLRIASGTLEIKLQPGQISLGKYELTDKALNLSFQYRIWIGIYSVQSHILEVTASQPNILRITL